MPESAPLAAPSNGHLSPAEEQERAVLADQARAELDTLLEHDMIMLRAVLCDLDARQLIPPGAFAQVDAEVLHAWVLQQKPAKLKEAIAQAGRWTPRLRRQHPLP
jgi:hypothetical protein